MTTTRRTATPVAALGLAATSLLLLAPAAHAAPVRECTNAQLTASYTAGDSATSHRFGRIVLRNTSSRICTVRGYGGLSYVGAGDGTQVGAAAERDRGTRPRTVVLAPGHRVRSLVSEAVAGVYDVGTCVPVPVDGFRVYVPDSRASQFVAHPTTGCADTGVRLLTHRAFRAA